MTDEEIMEAYESVGIRPGEYYARHRLLSAGRLILACVAKLPVAPPSPTHTNQEG